MDATYSFAPDLPDKYIDIFIMLLDFVHSTNSRERDESGLYADIGVDPYDFITEFFDREGESIAKRTPASWNAALR
jgi:hypothetical protein